MPDDDLTAELDRLGTIEQAATPGPWELHSHGRPRHHDVWYDEADAPLARDVSAEADGLLIVTARTAMPRLLAALRAVLELADEWDAVDPGHPCALMVREAITREITGKGESDGA